MAAHTSPNFHRRFAKPCYGNSKQAAIGETQELLAATMTGCASAVSADGKALILKTREIGTIGLPIDDAQISSIQTSLAQLLSIPSSARKN
jgi:hypothetical protein